MPFRYLSWKYQESHGRIKINGQNIGQLHITFSRKKNAVRFIPPIPPIRTFVQTAPTVSIKVLNLFRNFLQRFSGADTTGMMVETVALGTSEEVIVFLSVGDDESPNVTFRSLTFLTSGGDSTSATKKEAATAAAAANR